MLLGAIAGSRRRPSYAAVPLPFALGGFGAVYDPYHLASMVTSGGSAPAGAIGDQIVGIIPSHGSNETPTDGYPAPNRLILDTAGFGGFLNPLLTVKDGVQCWDMRDASHGRALGGNCLGVDMRASRKGCWGAMLWLDYDVEGSPMCMNRDASPAGLGLIVPWDMYSGRPNYPYGMAKIATSGVVPFFVDPTNTESSFKPAEGVTGGWFACIAQWSISSASNNAIVRYNSFINGVEKQDTTSSAKKVWDASTDADNYDRFTLGGQRDAGGKERGWDSWIERTFWTEDFLDDTGVAEMTAWLQGTAYVAPSFAAPFAPIFRMGAQTGSNVPAPDGGLPWLTTANAASAAPVSAAVTLAGSGDRYQDAGGSAGYGYDPSGNYLRFPQGALAEWELYGNPITIALAGVPNGPVRLNFIFREGYFTGPGNRIFDITLNGTLRQDNLDLAAVYGAGSVVCLSYDVTVSDGTLTIVLDASVDNACLTGVEVLV